MVRTSSALGLLRREKPTLPQLNLFEHGKTVYRVQTQYFAHLLKYSTSAVPRARPLIRTTTAAAVIQGLYASPIFVFEPDYDYRWYLMALVSDFWCAPSLMFLRLSAQTLQKRFSVSLNACLFSQFIFKYSSHDSELFINCNFFFFYIRGLTQCPFFAELSSVCVAGLFLRVPES